jgi:hypothetical protein
MELAVQGSSFLWKDDVGGTSDGNDDNDDKGQDCGGAGQQNKNIF